MSTYRELVYLCLDELKLHTDDSLFTEEHLIFLLNKYRVFVIKQRYSDIKKQIPESNYQTICLDLEKASTGVCDEPYLKSTTEVPYLMKLGNPVIHPENYYKGNITLVSRERMRFVGYNKYLQNIIYASIAPDSHLYLTSSNPQFIHLKKVRITGIFEDPQAASELQCPDENGDTVCDVLDKTFPIEDALIPPMIELVVKELLGAEYRPKDGTNDAKDELSEVASK